METVAPVTSGSLFYLYGFVSNGIDLPEITGVEQDSNVFLVQSDSAACVVSLVSAADYERLPDPGAAGAQLAWVTPRAWRHHEVLRQLHDRTAVIPLKFGTLCGSADDVRSMLGERRAPIRDLLDRARGKDEWTLQASADGEAVAALCQRTHPQLLAMSDDARRLPEGRAYFVRKQLQQATADLTAQWFADLHDSLCERLSASALEVAAASPVQRPPRADCLTLAVLVPRDRFPELSATLSDLEMEHDDVRLAFELVGPWPLYNFATGVT